MLRRERRSVGNTPGEAYHQQRGFHLRPEVHEHGAEMLPSGLILRKQPSDKVVNVDMGMTFSPPPSCQRQVCFCQGGANKASPDTENRQKLSLLARTGKPGQTVESG